MALSAFQPTLPFNLPGATVAAPYQGQMFGNLPVPYQQFTSQFPTAAIPMPAVSNPMVPPSAATTFADIRPTPRLFGAGGLSSPAGGGGFWNSAAPAESSYAQLPGIRAEAEAAQQAYSASLAQGRVASGLEAALPQVAASSSGIPAAVGSAMPADTAFASSLGQAVNTGGGVTARSLVPAGVGPSGVLGTLGAGFRGALPGAGAYMGAGMVRGMGDQANNGLLSGLGLGGQMGSLAAAGTGALAAAAPGLGVSALPLLPTVAVPAAGVALGNAVTGSGWGNSLVNAMRGAIGKDPTSDTFADLFRNGGALSSVPLLGQGDASAAGPNLSSEALTAKLNSMNLSSATRAQAVTDFNNAVAGARAAGQDNTTAMTNVYNQMFGTVDEKGQPVPGKIADYQAQDQQLKQQDAQDKETAHRAVAMQALISQLAPQILAPMISAGDQYNAMAPSVISSLPANMQGWAQKQGMDFNANQQNRIADTASFYNQLPLMLAQQQAATQQAQIQQQVQAVQNSNALQAAGITKNSSTGSSSSGLAALLEQAKAAAGQK